MKKAAIYIRVSTDAQAEEGYSIDAQKELLTAYCVSKEITRREMYIDGGFSGATINRPELSRLIADARAQKLSHVVVYKLDRLSRSQKDTLFLIEDVFNPNGVAFVSLMETIDTASPIGRLMIGILSAFAQLERENIRERTRMGMLERVKAGFWPGGGRTPFGYDYDREKGTLIPNDDAETVRRIYALYLSGYPLYRVAEMVGLKYERLARQVLIRRTNLGIIPYKGGEYAGRHAAIIDAETYHAAMDLRRERSAASMRGGGRAYMLSGLVRCGVCGAKMRYQRWSGGKTMLVCYSRDRSKRHIAPVGEKCVQKPVDAAYVEGEVRKILFSYRIDLEDGEKVPRAENSIAKSHAAAAKRLKRLYSLYADAEDGGLLELIDTARADLRRLEKLRDDEQSREREISARAKLRGEIEKLSSTWHLMTPRERQTVTRRFVGSVTIGGDEIAVELKV